MYKSVTVILVRLFLLVGSSALGVARTYAHPVPALGWGDARSSSTLATITVNSTADVAADDGQCTLREAMVAANTDTASGGASGECAAGLGDDTIDLTGVTGAIDLTGALPSIASGIVLNGPGADSLTVRRSAVENYRIFTVAAGMTATLSGLTVDNGSLVGENGGGIFNGGTLVLAGTVISGSSAYLGGGIFNVGTLTLTNSTVSDNSAEQGGGIDNDAGVVALIGSTVSGNQATGGGGGIANVGGSATLTNTTVTDNSADHGGGIGNGGTLVLDGSTVSDNEATSDGGGIANHSAGLADLTNCMVRGNIASSGGGISNDLNSRVELADTIVIENSVSDDGGGIDNSGTLVLYNSAVSNNESANGRGGGISNSIGGELTLAKSIVGGNSADLSGGGIHNSESTMELTGSTVISNEAVNGLGGGIYSAGQAVVTLNDSAVGDNRASGGGGILNRDGIVMLNDSIVSGNGGEEGGGIGNLGGRMILINSVVQGNHTDTSVAFGGHGGGIYNAVTGTLTLSNTTVSDNTVTNAAHDGYGGGIYNAGALVVSGSTVRGNDTSGDHCHGGGIHNEGMLTLDDSIVSGNNAGAAAAHGDGGGIHNVGGGSSAMLNNSTVSGNSSMGGGSGGGLWNSAGANMALTNCTVTLNNSFNNGGGINNTGNGTLALNSSTIGKFNYASGGGGGIWNDDSSTISLKNSIVAGNVAGSAGPDCHDTAALASLDYNIIGDDGGCSFAPQANDQVNVDPLLGELQDNGGPTETRALLAGSPAIDAIPVGNCTDRLGTPIAVDQRTVPRPQGVACDIGAYEVIKNVLYLPLVLDNYLPSAVFPLHIGDAIPVRPVAYQGEVFYTTSIPIPGQLPSGGHFYFSSQPDTVAAALVDDAMGVLLGGSEVFAYDFSTGGFPKPAIVEVPRATMEQVAGETVTIEYRDVYGSVVEASAMWLVWTP